MARSAYVQHLTGRHSAAGQFRNISNSARIRAYLSVFILSLLSSCTGAQIEANRMEKIANATASSFDACAAQIADNAEYENLKKKTSVTAPLQEMPLQMLSDNSLPTKDEIKLLYKLHSDRQECRKIVLDGASKHHPLTMMAIVDAFSEADKLWVEATGGRLSWGKFNQGRKDIDIRAQASLTQAQLQIGSKLENQHQNELAQRQRAAAALEHRVVDGLIGADRRAGGQGELVVARDDRHIRQPGPGRLLAQRLAAALDLVERGPSDRQLGRGRWLRQQGGLQSGKPAPRSIGNARQCRPVRGVVSQAQVPEQIAHDGDDARVREQIVHGAVAKMGRADGVTGPPCSEHARQQIIEIPAVLGNLVGIEDANALQISVSIERIDLGFR
jgi:hypothetical protein